MIYDIIQLESYVYFIDKSLIKIKSIIILVDNCYEILLGISLCRSFLISK